VVILNRLRFALFVAAIGLSFDLCGIFYVRGKHPLPFAVAVLVLIVLLLVNEIHQENVRREEREHAELMAAVVRRAFPVTEKEIKVAQ
jgi:hypothetical protein